ncbi:hypothetical protein EYC80_009185 [Monilinia laxa]|uniref:Uncharacterized protein n=1 Tax=Monilinia laxa TaxID=61186 RepID=A0A5N6K317_MONLA|nr:hypothetical protein EYC80_009185 [Monilinia laxa]
MINSPISIYEAEAFGSCHRCRELTRSVSWINDSQSWEYTCQPCSYQQYEYDTPPETTLQSESLIPVSEPCQQTIYHQRAPRKCLPILVNGFSCKAIADTGSEYNCISRDFAKTIRAKIKKSKNSQSFSLPINGYKLHSSEHISLDFCFENEQYIWHNVNFFVFKELARDIIIGNQFLQETGTLEEYAYRLQPIPGSLGDMAFVGSLNFQKKYLKCWLNGVRQHTLPDSGAEVNLISRRLASTLNPVKYQSSTTYMNIEFADGSTVQARGKVDLSVSFFEPSWEQSSYVHHELVDDGGGVSGIGTGTLKVSTQTVISEPFYIIDDLREDVILGETLLFTIDAYNQLKNNFLWGAPNARPSIGMFDGLTDGESWLSGSQNSAPVSEKDKLLKEYYAHDDKYKELCTLIDDHMRWRSPDSKISAAVQKKDYAVWEFQHWAGNNKNLLDYYFPNSSLYDNIMTLQ